MENRIKFVKVPGCGKFAADVPGVTRSMLTATGFKATCLGGVNISAKAAGSQTVNVMTYIVYLTPWMFGGHNMCAGGQHCKSFCLSGSGRAKASEFARQDNGGKNVITLARENRTRLFWNNRDYFTRRLFAEIVRGYKKAQRAGMGFAVRINGTSDISPLACRLADGRNILDICPGIQFYDYTKVIGRVQSWDRVKYPNYDLTFSYDGYNWDSCQAALAAGSRVSVVMEMPQPETFRGLTVVDGSKQDVRFADPAGVIVYLHYHRVAGDYRKINGRRVYKPRKTRFVVRSMRQKL